MGLDTYYQWIAGTLSRASPIRFDSGCKTRESTYKTEVRIFFPVLETILQEMA